MNCTKYVMMTDVRASAPVGVDTLVKCRHLTLRKRAHGGRANWSLSELYHIAS